MVFQQTNHKGLMVIHNLQTHFRLFVSIVYTRHLKIYFYLKASALFNMKIFTHWPTMRSGSFVIFYIDTLYSDNLIDVCEQMKKVNDAYRKCIGSRPASKFIFNIIYLSNDYDLDEDVSKYVF